jgi:hypothetical protein
VKTILAGASVAVAGAVLLVLAATTVSAWRVVLAAIGVAIFVFGGLGARPRE